MFKTEVAFNYCVLYSAITRHINTLVTFHILHNPPSEKSFAKTKIDFKFSSRLYYFDFDGKLLLESESSQNFIYLSFIYLFYIGFQ